MPVRLRRRPAGQFLESVYAVGDIPNAACGTFFRGYVTDADTIDLSNSFNWTDMRNKARGLAAGATPASGGGRVGIYVNLAADDPLGLHAQAAPNTGVLRLDRFDFHNTTLDPPDTVITYRRQRRCLNTVTGRACAPSEFNGIVFFENDANVKGTMNGVSGAQHHRLRHPLHHRPRGHHHRPHRIRSGDPAAQQLRRPGQPRTGGGELDHDPQDTSAAILRIDAALLSRTANWGFPSVHLPGHEAARLPGHVGPGPLDLDLDGIIGETPVQQRPRAGRRAGTRSVITADTWVLNINGPIITSVTGDACPWNNASSSAAPPARPAATTTTWT